MPRLSLLDLPQDRLVPPDVLAALREIEPTLTMIHMSADLWVTGYMRCSGEDIAQGRRILENTRRDIAASKRRLTDQLRQDRHDRLLVAQFKAMGAIGCKVWQTHRPDGAIVEQVRDHDFYHRHNTLNDFWRQVNYLKEKAERERNADLTDHARANDVWQYQHTLSHSPGIKTLASLPTPVRSGFIRSEKVA